MITAFICEFLITGGGGGVKLFKNPITGKLYEIETSNAFPKMQLVFYSIIIDENTEYINGNGYL